MLHKYMLSVPDCRRGTNKRQWVVKGCQKIHFIFLYRFKFSKLSKKKIQKLNYAPA